MSKCQDLQRFPKPPHTEKDSHLCNDDVMTLTDLEEQSRQGFGLLHGK